jgi:hypothetical protein
VSCSDRLDNEVSCSGRLDNEVSCSGRLEHCPLPPGHHSLGVERR